MKAHVLKGSKAEIVEQMNHLPGEVREAIVFVEDPAATPDEPRPPIDPHEDIFAEMDEHTVQVGEADYSREAIYSKMDGE